MFLHQAPHECKLWPLLFARLSATAVIFVLARRSRETYGYHVGSH
ncbi:MAG TPA: hypothetical protein VLZ05_01660 [Mycobacterium sp.]|nr:hypothetical protein [Mycobacterium sp.]HUH67681.1 hypothetical protein [Mycobacterium sp.]